MKIQAGRSFDERPVHGFGLAVLDRILIACTERITTGDTRDHGDYKDKSDRTMIFRFLFPVIPVRLLKKCFGIEDGVAAMKPYHNIS